MRTIPVNMKRFLLPLLLWCVSFSAHAFEPFEIEDIRVEGLQRISVGTVFNYLPVKLGERIDERTSSTAIRALYKTGFFKDVVLEREGNTLIVFVAERPAIASVTLEGNDDIPEDQLKENLKQIGLSEGKVLDRSLLDKVKVELKRQYLSLGKYNVTVKTKITPLERNRVAILIDIYEGKVAKIKQLNIVGNNAFPEETLLNEFNSGTEPMFSLFSDRDQYSKQKLQGDIETLRSYYMDRGYINFQVESTQVTITPDKSSVYITINVSEGEQYTVSDIKLAGNLRVPEEELRKLVKFEVGEYFSRRKVTASSNNISERLGDFGFAFSNVNPIPDIDKEKREVQITFFVDPGKRAYVRRVNIDGHAYTQDEVLRRELRQMESGWISTRQVKRTRTRLNRLGFFKEVNVETPSVPGSPDQVDVDYSVVENDTFGTLNFGIGYGEAQGLLLTAGINQNNFLGTGNRFGLNVSASSAAKDINFTFTDPYYTLDGVSRTFRLFYREVDAGELDISDYLTDSYGAGITFGVPISEDDTIRYGFDYEHTRIYTSDSSSTEIIQFCQENSSEDNCQFDAYKPRIGWTHDTRNRAVFPTSGSRIDITGVVAAPIGTDAINFYKTQYKQKQFFELSEKYTFLAKLDLAHGDSYGDTTFLPPFERYYAGGMRTVRGYKVSSLGPKDSDGDPIGGNTRVVGNLELIWKPPFAEKADSTRLSLFIDAGNVYGELEDVDFGELRYSTGIALNWLTPVGPLNFSLAKAINPKDDDETETFQFTMGTAF